MSRPEGARASVVSGYIAVYCEGTSPYRRVEMPGLTFIIRGEQRG